MSGISTDSRSNTGGGQWSQDTYGKERTIESVQRAEREKIRITVSEYNIRPE